MGRINNTPSKKIIDFVENFRNEKNISSSLLKISEVIKGLFQKDFEDYIGVLNVEKNF